MSFFKESQSEELQTQGLNHISRRKGTSPHMAHRIGRKSHQVERSHIKTCKPYCHSAAKASLLNRKKITQNLAHAISQKQLQKQCMRRSRDTAVEGTFLVISRLKDVAWDATEHITKTAVELRFLFGPRATKSSTSQPIHGKRVHITRSENTPPSAEASLTLKLDAESARGFVQGTAVKQAWQGAGNDAKPWILIHSSPSKDRPTGKHLYKGCYEINCNDCKHDETWLIYRQLGT